MTEKEFDFDEDDDLLPPLPTDEDLEDEPVPGEVPEEPAEPEPEIATSGSLTPAIIAEARALAGSPRGLEHEPFMLKHKLEVVNFEKVLHGELNKDGSLK